MKNRKIRLLLAVVAVFAAMAGLLLLGGCNNNSSGGGSSNDLTEIFIATSDLPKVKYVEGQELELKGGALTVVVGGEPGRMPLDNEEISVTGYDKNTIGKQTLTVTYKGLTTTFDVEVVHRLTAENYEAEYFVGDAFDNSKGRLWMTNDDGSSKQIAFNSEGVSLKSFDSSKGGKATVTLTYNESGVAYDCSFEVTVYEIGSIVPTFPKKTTYASHETEINLNGGYLTVKAKAPSTFSKYVPLTADMISGYNPSAVTSANKDTPVTQTVAINYGGQSFNFDVNISYSPVYLMSDVASALGELDFTGDNAPEISEEMGAAAADAIIVYLDMSPSDKALVKEDAVLKIARTATLYLNGMYLESSKVYSDTFVVNGDGTMSLIGKSYEAMEDAIDRLEDPNDLFNYYAEVLGEINTEFGSKVLYGANLFSTAIKVHTVESMENIIPMFKYMLTVYDLLECIPDQWTANDIKINGSAISVAADRMIISDYLGMSYFYLYDIISSWRTNDDYMDIIYTYYFDVKEGGTADIQQRLWNRLPGPGPLKDWYVNYIYAYTELQNINQNLQQAYLYDTVGMIYYYTEAKNIETSIYASNNELYKGIYELMNCGTELENNIFYGRYGYAFQMGEAMGHPAFEQAWDKYLTLVHSYLNDRDFSIENNAEEFEAAFDALTALSPSELYAFTSSMNFLYDQLQGSVLALDCKQYVYNTYMSLVASYYIQILPEDAGKLFPTLMNAMENYSHQTIREGAVEDFKANMQALETGLAALSEADRKAFMDALGDCYGKYVKIYEMVKAQDSITLTQEQMNQFEELWQAMNRFDAVVAYLNDSTVSAESKNKVTPLLFACYEKAASLYESISASDAKLAMSAKLYTADGISLTLDRRFFAVRALFMNVALTEISTEEITTRVWNVYGGNEFRAFLAAAEGIMYAEFSGTVYSGNDVTSIMNAFIKLSAEDKLVVYSLGVNQLYYAGIERYAANALGADANALELVKTLIEAEIAYGMNDSQSFNSLMAKATGLYGELSNTEDFDNLMGDMYTFYRGEYMKAGV